MGAAPHKVALTFDDGPDETWTPKILDILKQKHAPAAFFVIGESANQYPQHRETRIRSKATKSAITPSRTLISKPFRNRSCRSS